MDEPFITPEEVCELVPGMTKALLAQMRYRGDGPRWYAPTPRKRVYLASEVRAWVMASAHTRTDQPVNA